jgi:hypothetical protein
VCGDVVLDEASGVVFERSRPCSYCGFCAKKDGKCVTCEDRKVRAEVRDRERKKGVKRRRIFD